MVLGGSDSRRALRSRRLRGSTEMRVFSAWHLPFLCFAPRQPRGKTRLLLFRFTCDGVLRSLGCLLFRPAECQHFARAVKRLARSVTNGLPERLLWTIWRTSRFELIRRDSSRGGGLGLFGLAFERVQLAPEVAATFFSEGYSAAQHGECQRRENRMSYRGRRHRSTPV